MAIEEVYLHPEDYDLELASKKVDDVPFWLEVLREAEPRQVLEIGCGTGRLTIPFAREGAQRGFSVTGLDAEQSMLDRAAMRIQAEPAAVRHAVRLVQGDVRDPRLDGCFDTVIMPYGAAHHLLEIDEQIAAFTSVRQHMPKGALFCIDVAAPQLDELAPAQKVTSRRQDIDVHAADGRRLRRTVASHYAPATQEALHAYEYEAIDPDGEQRRYRSNFAMHIFYPRELELLCLHSGFQVERIIGSYTGKPFCDDSSLMIAMARAV